MKRASYLTAKSPPFHSPKQCQLPITRILSVSPLIGGGRTQAGPPQVGAVEEAPHQMAVEHTLVFHIVDPLPAPLGNVSKAPYRAGYATLRVQVKYFFDFLVSPNHAMLKLNESTVPYVALVNIPKSNKVIAIFCPGFGSSPIGSAPVPTDGKLLCLHRDGSLEGPLQLLLFLVSGVVCHPVTCDNDGCGWLH